MTIEICAGTNKLLDVLQRFFKNSANCQLPTANCQLPTANCQLPTANCQLPTLKKLQLFNLLSLLFKLLDGFCHFRQSRTFFFDDGGGRFVDEVFVDQFGGGFVDVDL